MLVESDIVVQPSEENVAPQVHQVRMVTAQQAARVWIRPADSPRVTICGHSYYAVESLDLYCNQWATIRADWPRCTTSTLEAYGRLTYRQKEVTDLAEGLIVEARVYARAQALNLWVFSDEQAGTLIGGCEYYSPEDLDRCFLRWAELRDLWPAHWGRVDRVALKMRQLWGLKRDRLKAGIGAQLRAEDVDFKREILERLGLRLCLYGPRLTLGPFEANFVTEEEAIDIVVREWAEIDLDSMVLDAKRWTRAVARFPQIQAAPVAQAI